MNKKDAICLAPFGILASIGMDLQLDFRLVGILKRKRRIEKRQERVERTASGEGRHCRLFILAD